MKTARLPKFISNKMFFSAFLTTSVIEISTVGAGFIDGIITTKMLGTTAMAAVGIICTYYSIVGVFSGLLSGGMQIIAGKLLSCGKKEEMQRLFSLVTLIATFISALMMLVFLPKRISSPCCLAPAAMPQNCCPKLPRT